MKRKLTILTCFIALCSFAFGQSDWGTLNDTYDSNMSGIFAVAINGVEQESENLVIGAFIDGELRGYQNKGQNTDGRYIYFTQIFGSGENDVNKTITFKLYNPDTNVEYTNCEFNNASFAVNGDIGSIDFVNGQLNLKPQILNFVVNVAKIGDVEYTTLEAAFNAATEGQTVTVINDVELESNVTVAADKVVTLDLNGKNLTGGAYVNLYINGELTIEDNVGNAVSTFRNHYVSNGGKLTLKSGILQNIETNTGGYGIFIEQGGESIIEGGTVQAVNKSNYAICVNGTLTIVDGNIVGKHGVIAVENPNAKVTIKDGEYTLNAITGNSDHIVYVPAGMVNIEGGNFTFNNFIANEGDSMIDAAEENVSITGGTYTQDVNEWCADGYAALPDLNGNFIVGTKPTATVNNLGSVTIPAGDYSIWNGSFDQNTEDDGDMPLSFVMQFLADQDAEDMATSPFADWYCDFVITFTGIENDSFIADGCYLAGHYGSFDWVKIPVDGMTIEDGVRYPVMLGVGLGQKYDYICSGVEDFKCALYLTPEILAANPNIQVNLELAIVDNSQGSDAAASALVNNTNVYEVVDYDYDAIDFMGYVAIIGETGYNTLAEAVEAATGGQTINLLRDAEGAGVVIDKNVVIDFGGFTYTFTSPAVGSTGTQTQGFQILKGKTVTLMHGTLNVAETAGDDFAMLIQNYANLTISNMTLDGDHLDRNNYSYVLSVNCGDVFIIGSTSILANEVEGENHFAFDSYDYSAGGYTKLPVVTIDTEGAIKGAVEVSATLNIKALGEGSKISYISIDGKGQLFHNGLTTTIKKHITGDPVPEDNSEYVGGWYTISSPIGTVNHTDVVGLLNENGTHDLYRYNEANAMWENVKNTEHSDFTTLEAGRGYIYANTADTELSFTGTLNTAAVKQQLSASHTELTGFNLIGNPFTYDIALENITGAELASGFYTLTKEGAWGASISSIGACQGALVKTTAASEITINPAAASKRTASENNGALAITVSNAKYSDVAYVSFNEGIGLDKINHRNANIPMVYVPVNGKNFAIATMSQDVNEIPVSFKASTMGQYTISVEAVDCEFNEMYLTDRMTGEKVNLLLEDYTFVATSNDNANRFVISFATTMPESVAENFIYINNGNMIINNIEGNAVVRVLDVLGRPVAEYNVTESANISTATLSSGVYMIQMYDNNGVKVQKVVVE